MCFNRPKPPPPPPPLPPPPPPPEPPREPLPPPEQAQDEVNPAVREARSKKDKNPYASGTESLRIPLDPDVQTGTTDPTGGISQ